MAEKNSPEYCTFRKNYEVLKNLQHGINSISAKAFAAGLISKDLRNKCSNEGIADSERTKYLLNALEDKMLYVPTTLQEFVDILLDTTSFEYIGKLLLASLEEETEKRKKTGVHLSSSSSHFVANLPASFEEAKEELSRTKLPEKVEPATTRLQNRRRSSTPPPKIVVPSKGPVVSIHRSPSLTTIDTPFFMDSNSRRVSLEVGNIQTTAKRMINRADTGRRQFQKTDGAGKQDPRVRRLQSIDSAGSDLYYTPRSSLNEDAVKAILAAKHDLAIDDGKVLARRESVQKLKDEIHVLKKQLSMCKKRDKEAEKQLVELREEMFKYVCDLGNEVLQLREKMEGAMSQTEETAKFVRNTILQAYSPTLCRDRRIGWAEEREGVGHTHSNPMGELMHIWSDI